jgi:hypothetical protein
VVCAVIYVKTARRSALNCATTSFWLSRRRCITSSNIPARPKIIAGISNLVRQVQVRLPKSKILLLGIFPRGENTDPVRAQVKAVNAGIAKLDDGKTVKYLDIGNKFLEPDGTLSRKIMPDLLHPSEKGYQIWADAMNPRLEQNDEAIKVKKCSNPPRRVSSKLATKFSLEIPPEFSQFNRTP